MNNVKKIFLQNNESTMPYTAYVGTDNFRLAGCPM